VRVVSGPELSKASPLHSVYAIITPPPGQPPPAATLLHAPSPQACSRSSEPAGRHDRFRVVPSAAAQPPPVRCERNRPTSSIPQTWYTRLLILPYLGVTGSRYNPS